MEDAKLESRTISLPNGRSGKEICVGVTKDHLSKMFVRESKPAFMIKNILVILRFAPELEMKIKPSFF